MDMEGREVEDIEIRGSSEAVEIKGSDEAVSREQFLTIGHQGKGYTYRREIISISYHFKGNFCYN